MTISTQALHHLYFNLQTTSQFPQHFHSFGYTSTKQIDSMLPCVFSVIDHKTRHILTSSVTYYWTDARQIKHKKSVFYCFARINLYHKANKEASAVYYTVIKHSGHLKRLEKYRKQINTRLWLVFATFPSCS